MDRIEKIGLVAVFVIPALAIAYAIAFNRMPHKQIQTAEEYCAERDMFVTHIYRSGYFCVSIDGQLFKIMR